MRYANRVATSAIRPATIGDSASGTSTFPTTVEVWIAPEPATAQVAPIKPPNRACEELEGSPSSQVSRFHRIAPTRPPKITSGVIRASSTSPPEMVRATCTERNAPTRFSTPASRTATRGRSAPLAIEVAIALAVSWNPFVKSKTNAVSTTATTTTDISALRDPHRQARDKFIDKHHANVAFGIPATSRL